MGTVNMGAEKGDWTLIVGLRNLFKWQNNEMEINFII